MPPTRPRHRRPAADAPPEPVCGGDGGPGPFGEGTALPLRGVQVRSSPACSTRLQRRYLVMKGGACLCHAAPVTGRTNEEEEAARRIYDMYNDDVGSPSRHQCIDHDLISFAATAASSRCMRATAARGTSALPPSSTLCYFLWAAPEPSGRTTISSGMHICTCLRCIYVFFFVRCQRNAGLPRVSLSGGEAAPPRAGVRSSRRLTGGQPEGCAVPRPLNIGR